MLLYFNSIKSYLSNDDTFKFNLAQVKQLGDIQSTSTNSIEILIVLQVQTVLGHYKEAEEELLTIQSAKYRAEYTYMECLTRCCKL